MRIAIDYDGTIAEYVKGDWGIHPFLEGAIDTLERWIDKGHKLMVYTARHNGERGEKVERYTRASIVNNIGDIPVHFGKPGDADVFIDDTPTKMLHVDTNVGVTQIEDDWLKAVPYFEELRDTLAKLPVSAIDEAVEMMRAAHWIGACGNGGSAATSSHLVADLQKIGYVAWPFDSQPTLTMWSNDEGYQRVFSSQLKVFHPDVLIAISVSGKSPNVLQAMELMHDYGDRNIALLGDNSPMKELADVAIVVPSDDYQIVEDCHLAICHYIITRLRHDNQ